MPNFLDQDGTVQLVEEIKELVDIEIAEITVLKAITPSISSFPVTFYSDRITAEHIIPKNGASLSDSSAVTGDVNWTTYDGSITFTGTMVSGGSTTIEFTLEKPDPITLSNTAP